MRTQTQVQHAIALQDVGGAIRTATAADDRLVIEQRTRALQVLWQLQSLVSWRYGSA